MSKSKKKNFTKKNISKSIQFKIGLSKLYTEKIINEFIVILKELVKSKDIVIKNFGTFKSTYKKEREGRNPKNKVKYKISARKSLSFISSKRLNEKINNS